MSSIHISLPILLLAVPPSQLLHSFSDAMDSSPALCGGAALHLRRHQGSNTLPAKKTKAKVLDTALKFRMYKKNKWT